MIQFMPLLWLNRLATARSLKVARKIAIAHPMHIGDVVAVLPLAGILKERFPHAAICFIGNSYVAPLVDCCEHVDEFFDAGAVAENPGLLASAGIDVFLNPFPDQKLAEAAYVAGIPVRVGNLRRRRIWRYCNRFVSYSRNNAGRHEVDLNLENLAGVGINPSFERSELPRYFGLTRTEPLCPDIASLLGGTEFNIVMHPKSNKNGREWPARHYAALAGSLPADRFRIFVTGVAQEGQILLGEVPELFALPHVVNLCGKLDLPQFLAFLAAADGIVASGTGPLHVAAAMGRYALGIFPPRVNIDPMHWAPVGSRAEFICLTEPCRPGIGRCPADFPGGSCYCTEAISPDQVLSRVLKWH